MQSSKQNTDMVKSVMVTNRQVRKFQFSLKFSVAALFVGSLLIVGCVPKSNTHQVKSSYAKIWDDRASKLQQEVAAQSTQQKVSTHKYDYLPPLVKRNTLQRSRMIFAAKKGALEVLTGFNTLRKEQPGLDVVGTWIRKRTEAYKAQLPAEKSDLIFLIKTVSGTSKRTETGAELSSESLDRAGFALGAITELQKIEVQLRLFLSSYKAAVKKDAAYRAANPTPHNPGAINAAIMGAMIGAGAVRY